MSVILNIYSLLFYKSYTFPQNIERELKLTKPKISKALKEQISKVTALRPKTVLDYLVKHGSITTDDIKALGYEHPPRAIRDVREQGIPLITQRVNINGKSIARYVFGDESQIEKNKLGGRQVFSKAFKNELIQKYGEKCGITLEPYDAKYLQIDHRIPYEVAGEMSGTQRTPHHFMLLCAAAQRQKSWECEHCSNLLGQKDITICQSCYWAYPEKYTHVALRQEQRLDLVFQNEEVAILEKLKLKAEAEGLTLKDVLIHLLSD